MISKKRIQIFVAAILWVVVPIAGLVAYANAPVGILYTRYQRGLLLASIGILPAEPQTIRPALASLLRLTPLTTAQEGTISLVDGDVWFNVDLACIRTRIAGTTSCISWTVPGSSAGVNAALTALPSTGGVVDARGMEGSFTFTTNPFSGINKPFVLLLGNATITSSVAWTITDADNWKIVGNGKTVLSFSAAHPAAGIELAGTISNYEITGMVIQGVGSAATLQEGVWNTGGATLTEGWVHNNQLKDLTVGLDLNGSSGQITVVASQNYISNIVGTASGSGYGIVATTNNSPNSSIKVINNTIDGAQRHSIYVAQGSGQHLVQGNTIKNHRSTVATGSHLVAMALARASNITATGNTFYNCFDGALSIEPDETVTNNPQDGVTVTGNVFRDTDGSDIFIGGTNPATSSRNRNFVVANNVFIRKGTVETGGVWFPSILVETGQYGRIEGNSFYNASTTNGTLSLIVLNGTGGGTYTDDLTIANNTGFISTSGGGNVYGVNFATGVATGSQRINLQGNRWIAGTADYLFDSTPTNTNIKIADWVNGVNGTLFSSGNARAVVVRNLAGDGDYYIGASSAAAPDLQFSNNAGVVKGTLTDAGDWTSRRIKSNGTALVAGDFALSAGWGTTASVGSVRGTDQFFEFVVTSSGTGQGASPTVTYTPKDGTWTTAPVWICTRQNYGSQPTVTFTVTTQTATSLVLTFGGTPVAAETFKVGCHTGGV